MVATTDFHEIRVMQQQRILILMSHTGGGHRASALALQAGFEQLYGDRYAIDIIDILRDYTFWPLSKAPTIYPVLANRAPWAWKLIYATERSPRFSVMLVQLASRLVAGKLRCAFEKYQPDLIISVHPLLQHVTIRVLAEMARRIPFATVITDLASTHPLWYHRQVDACFVPTEEAAQMALATGIPEERVHLLGLPVRPAFSLDYPNKMDLRRKLALSEDLPAVLLMSGGDGVGPVEEIAIGLEAALSPQESGVAGQIIVVCGRNDRLRNKLNSRRWSIPVKVNGFVDNMPEWMHASDCIVTKAGPGTIAEAMICGLPMVISGFIPGQEEDNVSFVVDQQVGAFSDDPTEIAHIAAGWCTSGQDTLREMARRAINLGRPQATFEIVRRVAELIQ